MKGGPLGDLQEASAYDHSHDSDARVYFGPCGIVRMGERPYVDWRR